LWIMAQFGKDASRAYHESMTMHLRGPFQAAAMRQSIQELIERHESLRTTFSSEGDYQRILPAFHLDIAWSDLSTLAEEAQERRVADIQASEIQKPFDLENGPLMRVHLIKLQEEHHLFVFTIHHIIADGRSVGTMMAELSVLYSNACSGTEAHLPEATQYREFVEWREQPEQQELMTSAQAYWLNQFTSLPPTLMLPTDFPRPARKTFKGAYYVTKVDANLCNELKNLSRQQHCTLFTTLLAAYAALLSRLTNQTDLVIAVSAAGHTLINNEHLVGHCVNLLPLRLKVEGDPVLAHYLQAVKTVLLNSYEHQIYPLSSLVEKLNLPRDPSTMPLVTTSFNLDRAGELSFEDLEVDIITNSTGFAKFDFDLNVVQTDTELLLECTYNTDLFQAQTIQRWMGYLKTLLQGMVQPSPLHFSELPLMGQEEEQQVLFAWNTTRMEYPSTACIHQLFEQQAQRTPEQTAVVFKDQQLSYRELNARANQLAHYLQRLGVGPDVLVGICMERSLDLVVGLLGIFKAGGAYVPMDPAYPQERLTYMLNNAHVSVLLTLQRIHEQLPTYQGQVVCLDTDWQMLNQEEQIAPACDVTADNLAYVIYTSGSTGQPKGAMVTQRGMLNHLFIKIRDLDLTPGDKVAQTASQCFDISVWQFFAALLQGGQVYIYPDEVAHDPLQLFAQVARERISILEIVPSLLRAYLDAIELLAEQVSVENSLRWLVVTGELFSAPLGKRWLQHFPQVALLNAYGPTECSDDVTHAVLDQAMLERGATALIGLPVGNTQIYILDHALQPLPIGVPGHIYVGGHGVGRGYVGDAVRTASAFIPDPFGEPGGRLYKTGDVGRYHPDGQIEFIQRVDHQVKVRGYRIELSEIEAVLEQHPAVRQSLVLVREDEPGQQRLVAYLVAMPGDEPTANQLSAWLHDKLPEYMIPMAFVLLEEFPLSANGKLERAALPAPERDHTVLATAYVAPRTATEELLADIWCEVLALERVGVMDNFFAIGGHSLPATKVIARLRKKLQVDLPLHVLFEHPTIAGLAEQLEQVQHKPSSTALSIADIRPRRALFPLSFAQRRLWFLSQLEPESPFYNIPIALHMQGPLQREALERSLSEIVQRHEILRTIVVLADGQPMQQVQPVGQFQLALTELSHLLPSQQQEHVQQSLQTEAMKPFELNKGPLMRGQLLRLSPTEHVLLLTMHHIIFDGWSHDVLMQELSTLYEAFSRGKSSPLSPLSLQYADYALWQREWLQNDVLAEQLAYWRKRLAGVPTVLNLPTDRPRPPAQTFRGAIAHFSVAPALSAALKELSQREGATLFMTLLAAFSVLLSRYSGQA
ncbi:MAG TPA: amino acid adenylation domain-containing protein, partial [Ktedonobacteraceae bacterium]|nr:amino acid adenylation domain-containing protein [Ktedonobacteraceae bacterium]